MAGGGEQPRDDGRGHLLRAVDACLHAAPRGAAGHEEVGPFTLFRPRGPHADYARPRPDAAPTTRDDLAHLDDRFRQLGLPLALEWIAGRSPELAQVCRDFGLRVTLGPLLVLEQTDPVDPVDPADPLGPHGPAVEIRVLDALSDLVPAALATASVAFGSPGTAIGVGGVPDRHTMEWLFSRERVALTTERMRSGQAVLAVALVAGEVVAVGQYQPVGSTAEIVAVATLPQFRRRGLAAAVTRVLVAHARDHGVVVMVLAAQDESMARIYDRVGFSWFDHQGHAAL